MACSLYCEDEKGLEPSIIMTRIPSVAKMKLKTKVIDFEARQYYEECIVESLSRACVSLNPLQGMC